MAAPIKCKRVWVAVYDMDFTTWLGVAHIEAAELSAIAVRIEKMDQSG